MRVDDPMRGVFQGLDIATSALRAELQRSEIVAANLANMHDTGTKTNEPYRRHAVVFEEALDEVSSLRGAPGGGEVASGVRLSRVYEDQETPFRQFQEEGHPHADEKGGVLASNVDMFKELVDLVVIERSYQANLAAMRSYRTMLSSTITNIGRT